MAMAILSNGSHSLEYGYKVTTFLRFAKMIMLKTQGTFHIIASFSKKPVTESQITDKQKSKKMQTEFYIIYIYYITLF